MYIIAFDNFGHWRRVKKGQYGAGKRKNSPATPTNAGNDVGAPIFKVTMVTVTVPAAKHAQYQSLTF